MCGPSVQIACSSGAESTVTPRPWKQGACCCRPSRAGRPALLPQLCSQSPDVACCELGCLPQAGHYVVLPVSTAVHAAPGPQRGEHVGLQPQERARGRHTRRLSHPAPEGARRQAAPVPGQRRHLPEAPAGAGGAARVQRGLQLQRAPGGALHGGKGAAAAACMPVHAGMVPPRLGVHVLNIP